ncbi:hypothetical protein GH714_029563 [Hevea brasiliensis]|uniref:Uncharacterized protein n=1 Tax=Hevea brasiliensis TaxID=3981 RepID=A0A6A6MG64_HEVBR|nr:hypothetical protein GH714_029563 [Hevea brasiliensis]
MASSIAPIIGAEFRAHGFRSAAALEALTKARKRRSQMWVEDLGLERCYLLDFLGPPGFAAMLSRQSMCKVLGFNRPPRIPSEECAEKVTFHTDIEESTVVYNYFSSKLLAMTSHNGVRADGNSNLSDEMDSQLNVKSAAAGLSLLFKQGPESPDLIPKQHTGGGGLPSSSSFIIRMDEYNQWLSDNAS